jgi:hypothetical protein
VVDNFAEQIVSSKRSEKVVAQRLKNHHEDSKHLPIHYVREYNVDQHRYRVLGFYFLSVMVFQI